MMQVLCLEIRTAGLQLSMSGAASPSAAALPVVSVTASVLHEEPDLNAELLLRRTSDGRFIILESKGTVRMFCYYMLLFPTS